MEITEAEYTKLRESFLMLSQISSYVEDFCEEDDTVLMGVLALLAEYHYMKSDDMYHRLDSLKRRQQKERE